ncbi:CPBP family intramembrane metalloprotease [Romeria aff. gracilis LEGE 07310]|uniref:CPBP family intramembrane metalloprotease n=1 Tax=Vasconcelosia minhoensis LEGE 07310 TaxID=915328 RepID=A0A8J7A583_9CYAN|nr:CPBP family intramembrane glutamic endopeptidase [Romeria gracilis]MBE9076622.1 CPBP family intramembrane metalloprotease [Romeria aff. gracilis LEGE 07310]
MKPACRWVARQTAGLRILFFLLLLLVIWAPAALLLTQLGRALGLQAVTEIAVYGLLYLEFVALLRVWGHRVYGWRRPLRRCGLSWCWGMGLDFLQALVIGLFSVFGLFGLEALLGWASSPGLTVAIASIALEGLLVGLGVGLTEELLFRGWLLTELEADYGPTMALLVSSAIFATAHFIKPLSDILATLPQFLGLALLGLALVWARRTPSHSGPQPRAGLGYPIGLHAGLVWGYYIVSVGQLSRSTGRAPDWLTGIDGNPLAGLLGLLVMGLIAWRFARVAYPKSG